MGVIVFLSRIICFALAILSVNSEYAVASRDGPISILSIEYRMVGNIVGYYYACVVI